MRQNILQKFIVTILISCAVVFLLASFSYADELAKLKKLSLKEVEDGFQLSFEHSKPPALFELNTQETPPKLFISIQGAKITFTR